MKTPRQLVRTCARRRCVLPIALFTAAAYLISSEQSRGSGAATRQQATQAAAAGEDLRQRAHNGPEYARTLAKPRNGEERQALAQHLASLAAAGTVTDTAVERNAVLTPAEKAGVVVQPVTEQPQQKAAPADKHLQHESGNSEITGHSDAARPTSSPSVADTSPSSAAVMAGSGVKPGPSTSPRVATFYYPWYGTPPADGKWAHWDHPQIEHWDTKQRARFPHGEKTRRVPPGSIGSNFYPESGPYSSRDPAVVATHMHQMRQAGIGVVVVSWYPPGTQDVVQGGKEITVEDGVLMPLVRRCRINKRASKPSMQSLQVLLIRLSSSIVFHCQMLMSGSRTAAKHLKQCENTSKIVHCDESLIWSLTLVAISVRVQVLRCAEQEGLKVALHVEPYEGRNAATLRRDVEYASKTYGQHPAMQKHKGKIVYYLYD
eukprot:COSAG02_NODE_12950_length_1468_cov_1.379109_1_plen_431_part_01